jgi:hypothetical protein
MYSKLPILGSKKMTKNYDKLIKVQEMYHGAIKRFEPFEVGNWKYIN